MNKWRTAGSVPSPYIDIALYEQAKNKDWSKPESALIPIETQFSNKNIIYYV